MVQHHGPTIPMYNTAATRCERVGEILEGQQKLVRSIAQSPAFARREGAYNYKHIIFPHGITNTGASLKEEMSHELHLVHPAGVEPSGLSIYNGWKRNPIL